jgi:hypothetical protein
MDKTSVKMEFFGAALMVNVRLWDITEHRYRWAYLNFDTGASITTISTEMLYQLGYEPAKKDKALITTASDVVRVSQFRLNKMMIGDIEIADVDVYAHKFPEECFSLGVVGLNVLRCFDIELLFSKQIIKLKKNTRGGSYAD